MYKLVSPKPWKTDKITLTKRLMRCKLNISSGNKWWERQARCFCWSQPWTGEATTRPVSYMPVTVPSWGTVAGRHDWGELSRESASIWGFPGGSRVKNPSASAGDAGDPRVVGLIPGSGRSPGNRKWQPTPVFLPGSFHGEGSLAGYSP